MKGLILSFVSFLAHDPVMACVGCRTPMVDGLEEPQTILAGIGFSWGVIMMLVIVLGVIAGLSSYMVQTCRRVDSENASR